MAERAQPLSPLPGISAALLVAALIVGTLVAVLVRAEPGRGLGVGDLAALRFTLIQAMLSAGLSVAIAIPVARALARRRFAGRAALIALLGAPFILPVIVAIMALLQVFGRAGWLNDVLFWVGLPGVQIYGLHGVVLAHVFFNLPLATRLILQAWQEVPAERFRLAAQLGVNGWAMFRLIELPMLARVVPGALAVVFAICLSSFAVALTLGGGPRATTVELAIFQAFRYDFDLTRAAMLSGLQLILTSIAALIALRLSRADGMGDGLDRSLRRWDARGPMARVCDTIWIALAGAFLMLPLTALIFKGVTSIVSLPMAVWSAALTSVLVAVASTTVLLCMAVPMAAALATRHGRWIEVAGILGLAASPLVIGTGLFLVLRPVSDPSNWALPVTALVNAVMALPFALRILSPAARDTALRYGRLGCALNMGGAPFFWRVFVPRLRPQIAFSAGLGAALSIGDLGVITLFATSDQATLPLQMYRLMGAYQMEAAAGAALLLLSLSMGAFWILDRGGRWHAEA
ncbi:thiamine/thiamine pyrophosphate ABC transporter permease ThiP [Roseovarius aestuarii]|nr:thiamine/thiamine pyrophosphate ABC transporter permease ThiP [Roseovarius aestuarii]